MIAHALDAAAAVALWTALKASVLLAAAGLAQRAWGRRASAATRHLVWTLTIVGMLLLPAAAYLAPAWPVVVHRASAPAAVSHTAPSLGGRAVHATVATSSSTDSPASAHVDAAAASARPAAAFNWMTIAGGVYLAGALVLLAHLLVERHRVRRFARATVVVEDTTWTEILRDAAGAMGVRGAVRLLRSRRCAVPVACGTLRPAIVLPAVADTWTDDRRRAVVLHEIAHVARHDCLAQALASIACALYWFHPGAWWVTRRLRVERELACDDRVILAGTEAHAYAGHLLEIAYSLGRHPAPALAVGMARPHQLEGRMRAALDDTRDRRRPTRAATAGWVAAAVLVLGSIAGARPLMIVDNSGIDTMSRPSATPVVPAAPAAPVAHVLPKSLKRLDAPLVGDLRRLVDAAAEALGLPADEHAGTWELEASGTAGVVHLRMKEGHSSSGNNVPIERLEGLTSAQLAGSGGQVRFRLRRDAGTFEFEGTVRGGVAAGTFSFAADPKFGAELARRGYAVPSPREQYELAKYDLGYAFVDELAAQRYPRPPIAGLVTAGQHGVDTRYLHEMGALGYTQGSIDVLVTLRDHGVTPEYVRELGDLGYKGLSAEDVRVARDHGVTPDFVRGLREAGSGTLPLPRLIEVRDHGVTPDFVRELGEAGFRNVPVDALVRVRDHGVTPDYVRDMRELGYTVPLDELVRLRDHGVTAQYAREVKALGYEGLTADDLVTLRDHGVTPDRIRSANARTGSRLPIDQLRSLADRGQL